MGTVNVVFVRLTSTRAVAGEWRGTMSEIVLIFHLMIVLFFIAGFFVFLLQKEKD